MINIANIVENFVNEYKNTYKKEDVLYEESLVGDIKKIKDKLLNERFHPSIQLEQTLNKQIRRARYPVEVAIAGQFSSGKSTFLNALLSKDILPTGITPVTSKVNFINYGKEYSMKITYYSGAQEYHSIDSISKFTDQREDELDDIKYITIYAPMKILKEISFVDTPGLNSQSMSDTQTTKNILKDVGGIIWLTLIDNAGKLSEKEVLDEYMPAFKTKSLCVLNQKDKFSEEQIQTTKNYIEDKFSKYFVQVTPISAKLALDARADEKSIKLDNSLSTLMDNFKSGIKNNSHCKTLKFFESDFAKFQNELEEIENLNIEQNEEILQQSNIQEVLNFIKHTIRPNASKSKEYAIKNDLKGICDILSKEYETILAVFDSLENTLTSLFQPSINAFNAINTTNQGQLISIENNINNIMEKISFEIYKNINTQISNRYEKKDKTLFKGEVIEEYEYDTFVINNDNIFKSLFYDDQTIAKMIKRVMKELKHLEITTNEDFLQIYNTMLSSINSWKSHYILLRKNREIASDYEFSSIRRFASSVNETILSEFHVKILANIAALNKKLSYFNGALSYNYEQNIQATVAFFEQQILESEELHKTEPLKFEIKQPTQEEILHKLKENFSFTKIEDFLSSKRNYLYKIVQYSKREYEELNEIKLQYIKNEKSPYLLKIETLKKIKEEI